MDPPNLLLLLLLMFASTIHAQWPETHCGSTGNFTAGSTYETTLTGLLSSISPNKSSLSYGFFNASAAVSGTSQNLYVLGLCFQHRGGVTAIGCGDCLSDSTSYIRRLCPLSKEALLYTGDCLIQYSDTSLFGTLQTNYVHLASSGVTALSPDKEEVAMTKLMNELGAEAAGGSSLIKYAMGNKSMESGSVHAAVQCMPDLTKEQCNACVSTGVENLKNCCIRKTAGRFMVPSCIIEYWFDSQPPPPPKVVRPPPPPKVVPPPPPTVELPPPPKVALPLPPVGKRNSMRTVIVAVITSVSALLVISIVVVLLKVKRKMKEPRQSFEGEVVHDITMAESLQFDFSTIRAATENFSDSKKLGEGGFGAVYMGQLSNGQKIAVKRLSQNSSQGKLEFKNECTLLARLQHRNLVKLLGFCLEGVEQLLVYEFVPNSSLDQLLFDPQKCANFNWDKRYKIIKGVARGVLYLHEDSRLHIIHRDLKASNILLDSDMNPKISDFGMARLFELDQSHAKTKRIVGTYGYMAPEYAMHGNISIRSDVFSFGVLVLEIISGQRNNLFNMDDHTEILISYIWKSWREGSISKIIDPFIISGSSTEIARCIHIGLLCVQEKVASRPTMASALLMLNSHSVTLPVPSRPAFFLHGDMESDTCMQGYNSSVSEVERSGSKSNEFSKNEASMTEPYPR